MAGTGQPPTDRVVNRPRAAERPSCVELRLPARAENVALVRHVLDALAGPLGIGEDVIADMRLAVTEACTNVIRHAYGDGERGIIDLAITPTPDSLRIVVGDRGRGIGPSPDSRGPGFGFPLMAAVADSLEIQQSPGAGSRVAMAFARRRREAAA